MVNYTKGATQIALVLAGLLGLHAPALAGSASRSFTMTAVYQQTCSIAPISAIDFGTLTASSTSSSTAGATVTYEAAASVFVWCTNGTPYGVWIPLSSNSSGSQRRLFNSTQSAYLNYNLYQDQSRSTQFSTTRVSSGRTSAIGGIFSNLGDQIVIYAVIPAGQTLSTGHYEDIVSFTVSY